MTGTGGQRQPGWFLPAPTLHDKKNAELKQAWLDVDRASPQCMPSHSPETLKYKGTNSLISNTETLASYAENSHMHCKYDLGYEKFNKMNELGCRRLKKIKQLGPVGVLRHSASVASSPKKRSFPTPMTSSLILIPKKLTTLKKISTSPDKMINIGQWSCYALQPLSYHTRKCLPQNLSHLPRPIWICPPLKACILPVHQIYAPGQSFPTTQNAKLTKRHRSPFF